MKKKESFTFITPLNQSMNLLFIRIDSSKCFIHVKLLVGIKQACMPTLAKHLGYY